MPVAQLNDDGDTEVVLHNTQNIWLSLHTRRMSGLLFANFNQWHKR